MKENKIRSPKARTFGVISSLLAAYGQHLDEQLMWLGGKNSSSGHCSHPFLMYFMHHRKTCDYIVPQKLQQNQGFSQDNNLFPYVGIDFLHGSPYTGPHPYLTASKLHACSRINTAKKTSNHVERTSCLGCHQRVSIPGSSTTLLQDLGFLNKGFPS